MFIFIYNYLEPFSHLIYLLAIIIYYRQAEWRNGRLLMACHGLVFLFMLAASLMVGRTDNVNIWLYNLSALCTAVFISAYFRQILQPAAKKKVVFVLIGINIFYSLVKNIVFQEFYLFDSVGYSLVSATVVVCVFMYFHQVLKNVTEQNILRQINFWIASCYLLYFLGSFIIFLSYYYFTKKVIVTHTQQDKYLMNALWGLHNLLLFVSALLLLTGSVWLTYRKKSV